MAGGTGVAVPAQAQFGDEAVKEQHRQDAAAKGKRRGAAPVGDVNAIPLGQRPQAEEEEAPKQAPLDPIPDVEWWDARLLRDPQVPPLPTPLRL